LTGRDLLQLTRPWQWSKNGIIFAGLIFSLHLADPGYGLRSLLAFFVFCLGSSTVYIVNDLSDIARDRLHPVKRNRPLAAGRVSRGRAAALTAVLLAATLGGGWVLGPQFFLSLVLFLLVNAAYSVYLRNLVILDVMLIAVSFVIRAIAGVLALRPLDAALELSPWLLVCTLFLALFLALGKRRHELVLLEEDAAGHRASLGDYSPQFLDQLMAIVTAAALIGYAIYTIAPGTLSKFHSPALVFTIPFVTYGIFRYLFLVQQRQEGGNPSRALYRDLPLFVTILAWLGLVLAILYRDGF
jgi:4-hydroxybenzoate polyprenyltransferase